MPAFSVSAHDIDTAGLAFDAELPVPWLDAELGDAGVTARAPGRLAVRLSRSGHDVVVRGRVRAPVAIPCARCLEPAAFDVDTELSLLLQPASPGDAGHKGGDDDEEHEFSSADADRDTYDGETVVLDGFVREAILLEVPNFPLCSEGCPGIRPAAPPAPEEAGPHIDPRLAPLGALKAKLAPPKKKDKE